MVQGRQRAEFDRSSDLEKTGRSERKGWQKETRASEEDEETEGFIEKDQSAAKGRWKEVESPTEPEAKKIGYSIRTVCEDVLVFHRSFT